MKVLVIDDEDLVLESTRATLEDMGHDVSTRASAMGASAAILRECPEIVLLDISMPALHGDEWLQLVAEHDPMAGKQPPAFILFSGADPSVLEEMVKGTCAAGYISKQWGPEGLESAFRKISEGLFE